MLDPHTMRHLQDWQVERAARVRHRRRPDDVDRRGHAREGSRWI